MKMKKRELGLKPSDDGGGQAAPEEIVQQVTKNVTCQYGIHRGNYPIAGLKVKDARTTLKKLMKIDDSAMAVINGEEVDGEHVISSETTLLSFVKPSAKKGAEVISIEGRNVRYGEKKLGVDKFCGLVTQNTISGMYDQPIPDNVKWIARAGKLEVYIVELKPELRLVNWNGAPHGTGSYKKRRLATPYVVLAVPFVSGQIYPSLELFYRTEPLKSLDDKLSTCNLLNVSMGRKVAGRVGLKTWVCTQYLNVPPGSSQADCLSEIISHIFGGGFNRSSDANEGASGFSHYEKNSSDERVTDVDRWEEESEKDPRFVLDVQWLDAGCTPRDLINFRMRQFNVAQAPDTSKALSSILLSSGQMA